MPPSPAQPDPKEAVEGRLCAYLEGDLVEDDRADLERHLATNPQHRRLLAELAEQRLWLRAVPAVPAPPEVGDAYREQVERSLLMGEGERPATRRGGLWPQYAMVAALVLATVGLAVPLVMILSGPGPAHQVAADLPTRPPPPAIDSTPPIPAVVSRDDVKVADSPLPATPPSEAVEPLAAAAAQNSVGNASQNAVGQAVEQNAPAADLPVPDTVHLTVTAGDPVAVGSRIRAFAAGAHVALADGPEPAAVSAPAPPPPAMAMSRARSSSAKSLAAAAPPSAGGRAGTAPARYTLTGLTADQARRLATDLSATVDAGRPIRPGETVTVTVAQLAGKPGLTPANVVRVAADGTVALPMLDPVPAAGATADALARRVADGYRQAHLIPQPTVTVTADADPDTQPAARRVGGVLPSTTTRPTGTTVVIEVRPAPALPAR